MIRFPFVFLLTITLLTSALRAVEPEGHNAGSDHARSGIANADASLNPGDGATVHSATGHGEGPAAALTPFAGTIAQSIAAILVFGIVFYILKAKAWGPILTGLQEREGKIKRDLADAEAARVRAEESQKQYATQIAGAEGQIRDLLAKATADAEKIGTNLKMQAQQEAEEIKERAAREIESAKNQALREVYEQTAILATSVAEKILKRNLNADDQRSLVNESLNELAASKN